MKLKLLDAEKAKVYGLPEQDTDTDAVIKEYEAHGWKADAVMAHIGAAVFAGAYQVEKAAPAARHEKKEA